MNRKCSSENIVSQIANYQIVQIQSQTLQYIFYISLQFVYRAVLIRMCPWISNFLSGYPQPEVIIFRIGSQYFFRVLLVRIEVIAVTEFEEFQISILTVGIVSNAFQSAKQQCLTHTVQIGTQRIQQHHQMVGRIVLQAIVISRTSQRVVQYFVETTANQLFCNQIL